MYVASGRASKFYGVTDDTLRRWAKEGLVEFTRTPKGHYRFMLHDGKRQGGRNICYARVSSKKQAADLERQAAFVSDNFPGYEVLTDIGSGLNDKRRNFRHILAELFKGHINRVVVASPDRWARFGATGLFAWIFSCFNAELHFLSEDSQKASDELTDQLMEVLTVFVAKYNGKRRYALSKDKDPPDENPTKEV